MSKADSECVTYESSSPNGPRVLVEGDIPVEAILDALPREMEVHSDNWNNGVRLADGRMSYPVTEVPRAWVAADDSGVEVTTTGGTAREAAQSYVDSGDWDRERTMFHHVRVWPLGEEDDTETFEITVDPAEPSCSEDEHDWQSPHAIVGGLRSNPGVRGNGGGVISTEVCMNCGCSRTTDTWATDPGNGTQGHTTVSYEPGRYTAQLARLRE